MSAPSEERPDAGHAHSDATATSVRVDTPSASPSGGASPSATGGEVGGLNDYLASLSTLGLNPSIDGPKRLTAAEVRRHTTGRMRAISDAPDPPRRPTTGRMRAVSDARTPSRTGTGRMATIPAVSTGTARRRYLLPALALLVACAILLPRLFTPAVPVALPKELQGEWMTLHPQYASRRLVLTATEVGIAVSASRAPIMYPITSTQRSGSGDTTRYVISYAQDGEAVQLQLQFHRRPQRRVVLANPPDVFWFPVSEAPLEIPPVSTIAADSVPHSDLDAPAR